MVLLILLRDDFITRNFKGKHWQGFNYQNVFIRLRRRYSFEILLHSKLINLKEILYYSIIIILHFVISLFQVEKEIFTSIVYWYCDQVENKELFFFQFFFTWIIFIHNLLYEMSFNIFLLYVKIIIPKYKFC